MNPQTILAIVGAGLIALSQNEAIKNGKFGVYISAVLAAAGGAILLYTKRESLPIVGKIFGSPREKSQVPELFPLQPIDHTEQETPRHVPPMPRTPPGSEIKE